MFSKKKLEELIAKAKITPTELSRLSKIQQTTISRLLTGNTNKPHPDTLDSLARFFKVKPDFFFEQDNKEKIDSSNHKKESFVKFNNTKDVLEFVMKKNGIINSLMLHKNTGIPLTNLNRIIKGETENASLKTLQQLAQYFNLSLPQMRGQEEIALDKIKETSPMQKMIPIFTLDELPEWFENTSQKIIAQNFIPTMKKIYGDKAFAISIPSYDFLPEFKKDDILIFDSKLKIIDNDIIAAKIPKKKEVSFYLYKDLTLKEVGKKDLFEFDSDKTIVYGVAVQEIRNLRN